MLSPRLSTRLGVTLLCSHGRHGLDTLIYVILAVHKARVRQRNCWQSGCQHCTVS